MQREKGVFKPTKLTLVAILLSSMLILMGGAAVAPALPLIEVNFPGQESLVSLIITLPSLAVAIVGYAIGVLADKLGKVRVLLTALAIFTVFGFAGYFMEGNIWMMLAVRFILGIGIAGITSTVTALIAEYYGGIQRVKVLSYQSAAMGIGVLILEFVGGTLAEFSWTWPSSPSGSPRCPSTTGRRSRRSSPTRSSGRPTTGWSPSATRRSSSA